VNYAVSGGKRKAHVCVTKDGRILCWGANTSGQLGLGNTETVGDARDEMGANLHAVDLGRDFVVAKVERGTDDTCALSTTGKLKCWGGNDKGQLGRGDSGARGDAAGEMGDALAPVDLGSGVIVKDFAMGARHVCVLTTDDRVKCFGDNASGQLGYGDTSNRGDGAGEMGDALPFVDLGTGQTAVQLSLGDSHSCVVTSSNRLVCFGKADAGQLGNGAIADVGTGADQMGDHLVAVDLGTTAQIASVTSGADFNCVLFGDGSLKCFGGNSYGQLGLGDALPRGRDAATLGAALPPVNLGISQIPQSVQCDQFSCCALLIQRTFKCWGANASGQLGLGDTVARGDHAGQMGDELPQVSFGELSQVVELTLQGDSACARDEHGWKCWGGNRKGTLGYGDSRTRGDSATTVPAQLPYISL
jgi:alpha-tubulin suppressor-like RCC1 family protein